MSFNTFVGMSAMEDLAIFPDSSPPLDPLAPHLNTNSWPWDVDQNSCSHRDLMASSVVSFDKLVAEGSNTSRAADGSVLAGNELARLLANGLAFWNCQKKYDSLHSRDTIFLFNSIWFCFKHTIFFARIGTNSSKLNSADRYQQFEVKVTKRITVDGEHNIRLMRILLVQNRSNMPAQCVLELAKAEQSSSVHIALLRRLIADFWHVIVGPNRANAPTGIGTVPGWRKGPTASTLEAH